MIPTDPVVANTAIWCIIGGLGLFTLCWWVIPALLHKIWVGRAGFIRRNLIANDPCPERTHPKAERYNPADDADHVCYGGTLYDVQTRRLS